MVEGRLVKTALWGLVGGMLEGMAMVMEKLWRETRRLANSTRGIRWPTPGLGTITRWGWESKCRASMAAEMGVESEELKHGTHRNLIY